MVDKLATMPLRLMALCSCPYLRETLLPGDTNCCCRPGKGGVKRLPTAPASLVWLRTSRQAVIDFDIGLRNLDLIMVATLREKT
jgi:hypothetical protein